MTASPELPWQPGSVPLMLAPMQGLTNRALRSLFIEQVRPDVVFTEFVRVKASSRKNISANDRQEVMHAPGDVPLVVQLIGSDPDALLAAAATVQGLGARHLNINLGCPYGRMTGNACGGGLLRDPQRLAPILRDLRAAIRGTFSVKARAGFIDPGELPALLPLFEECAIDFLIVHPRTVQQRYAGPADHRITAEVVRRTHLPVIANGDIFTAADGHRVLAETGAAGLMLGRGAINDPLLFERLRGRAPVEIDDASRYAELRDYLRELLRRYQALFCGDQQVLCKMKEVLAQVRESAEVRSVRQLLRSRSLDQFVERLASLGNEGAGQD
ncbi:MAG: tRNA dihydrouridine synthase [Thermodesulfobacteriota bacterium]